MNDPAGGLLAMLCFSTSLLCAYRVLRRVRLEKAAAAMSPGLAPYARSFPQRVSESATVLQRFDGWFLRLCYFVAGGVAPQTAVVSMAVAGAVVAGAVFVLTADPVLTVLGAVFAFAMVLLLMVVARRRAVAEFQKQFPAALDLFSRAIRAGESVDQAMQLLATARIGEPSQTEFRRCAGHLEMGLSLPATLRSMCDRMDLTDVRIFSAAMIAHRDGGGNLATTLERLAAVIRDRVNYRRQLKVVTGASRISVMLIAGLGPILFAWLFLVHPEYGAGLWQDSTGQGMLIYAIVSEVVGLCIVGALMRAEY